MGVPSVGNGVNGGGVAGAGVTGAGVVTTASVGGGVSGMVVGAGVSGIGGRVGGRTAGSVGDNVLFVPRSSWPCADGASASTDATARANE